MKILQVLPYFHWSYGGSVRVAYDLAIKLAERGHDVSIYTTNVGLDGSLTRNQEIKNDLLEIKYFKCLNNYLANDLKLHISSEMKKAIKNNLNNFDLVHLYEWRGIPNIYVWYYAKKYKIPYILEANGSSQLIIGGNSLGRTFSKKIFDGMVGTKILLNASKFRALTNREKEDYKLLHIENKNIEVIPNGITPENFKNVDMIGFKDKYGINEDIILYLGRLNERKGIDFLIKSFNTLLNEKDNLMLVIVGPDDGFKGELQKLVMKLGIVNKVKFIDFMENVVEAYKDSSILVYPSKQEIFGLVPFEAVIAGVPVIVSDDSGCGEIVKEAGCGLLVEYGNVEDLKNKIKYLLENPEEGHLMVERGQKYIEEKLDWDKVSEKIEKLYIDVLREKVV